MMAPAADAMAEALAKVDINAPVVPLIANIHAAPISDPDEIRKGLVSQVTGQVRWNESIGWLGDNGVDTLIEVGSGKVLSGLAKRINREIQTIAVGSPDDVAALLEKMA
jgi:[acyl-carrier-protein] S-malonyltransferase